MAQLRTVNHLLFLIIILLLLVPFAGTGPLQAQPQDLPGPPPAVIAYHGTLRDAEGRLITGTRTLTLAIYNSPAPTARKLWEQTYTGVPVRDGQFSVLIGDGTPLDRSVFSSPDRFIGITLQGFSELQPRQRFVSAPYALSASYLTGKGSASVDGNGAFVLASNGKTVTLGTSGAAVDFGSTNDLNLNSGSVARINARSAEVNSPDGRITLTGRDVVLGNGTTTVNGLLNVNGGQNIQGALGVAQRLVVGGRADLNGGVVLNGDTQLNGNVFTPGGSRPVVIKRIIGLADDQPAIPLGVYNNDYVCTPAGWTALWDVREDNQGRTKIWTFVGGDNQWYLKVDFYSQGRPDSSDHDVLCFNRRITGYEGEVFHNP